MNIAGQAACLLIGFVASIALARWLGPSDRGLLAVLTSVSGITLVVCGLGLPLAILYAQSTGQATAPALLGASLAYAGALTAVLVGGTWLFSHELASVLSKGEGSAEWVLAAVLVGVTFLDYATHNQVLGSLRFGYFNGLAVVSRLAYLGAIVVLVGVLAMGAAGGLIALILSSLVAIAMSLRVAVSYGRPRFDLSVLRAVVGYGLRVQIGSLFEAMNFRLDVIVLQFFVPLASVGYYVIAQIIAELVLTLARAFQQSVMPLVAHDESDAGRRETLSASMRHHSLLAAAGVAGNAVIGTLVILYGYGEAFHSAILPMLVLLPGIWLLGAAQVAGSAFRGLGRPGVSSTLAASAALATVVLDLALIPPLGVTGAALASFLAYSVYGAASVVLLARATRLPIRSLVLPTRAEVAVYRRLAERARDAVRRRLGLVP